MELEIDSKLNDDIIKNHLTNICKKLQLTFSITNYAIQCNGKLVCYCGSDILTADNVKNELKKIYTNKTFTITEEFLEIS